MVSLSALLRKTCIYTNYNIETANEKYFNNNKKDVRKELPVVAIYTSRTKADGTSIS